MLTAAGPFGSDRRDGGAAAAFPKQERGALLLEVSLALGAAAVALALALAFWRQHWIQTLEWRAGLDAIVAARNAGARKRIGAGIQAGRGTPPGAPFQPTLSRPRPAPEPAPAPGPGVSPPRADAGFGLLEVLAALALTAWLGLWMQEWLLGQRLALQEAELTARAAERSLHLDSWLRGQLQMAEFASCAPGDLEPSVQVVDPQRPAARWASALRTASPGTNALQLSFLEPIPRRARAWVRKAQRVWVANCAARPGPPQGRGAAGAGAWMPPARAKALRSAQGIHLYQQRLVLLYTRRSGGSAASSLYMDSATGTPTEVLAGIYGLRFRVSPGALSWSAQISGTRDGEEAAGGLVPYEGLAAARTGAGGG